MDEMKDPEALSRLAKQGVPDTLDLWPAIRAGIEAGRERRAAPARNRRLWLGLAAAVFLALGLGAASILWSRPEPASAEAILDRAQSTTDAPIAVHSYHLEMTQQIPGKGNVTALTEIWYGGPDRQRNDVRVTDAAGTLVSASQTIFNGPQVWLASTEQGATRVIHTTGTKWTAPDADPSRQLSLTDVLAQYSNNKACMDAQLQGSATVAAQAAYIIRLTPRAAGCAPGAGETMAKAGPTPDPGVGQLQRDIAKESAARPGGRAEVLVWVDKVSYLPLKTEVRDASGAVLDRSEVTSVQYNPAIPDAVFSYAPPAGASVFNFSGGKGADVKERMCREVPTLNCGPTPAGKKP